MSRDARTPFPLLLVLVSGALALVASGAHAAVYTVGHTIACTHATIQAAAASAELNPGPDTIRVAFPSAGNPNVPYPNQAIAFTASQELDIIGGYLDCSSGVINGRVILDGAGGATEPVLRITVPAGGLVRMSNLTVRNGDEDGSGKGGGIHFKGDGILELNHCAISQNIAGSGGGIYAEGTGNAAELVIGEDVAIVGNTARYNGGGVVNDGTEMTMTQPDSYIANNEAQGVFLAPPVSQWTGGYGGGLLVLSENRGAVTYLGSSGFGNAGAIYINNARKGGGVAILGRHNVADLELFSTDPARPMRIKGNSASVDGGGVYLGRSGGDPASRGELLAWFVYVEDNLAPRGAAVAVRESAGTGYGVRVNDPAHRPLGSINCPVDKPCGSISGNIATDIASQPTGGIVEVSNFGSTNFYRMTFEGNTGQSVFRGDGSIGGLEFETHHVAITGNSLSSYLITTGETGYVSLHDTTISGNSISATAVMRIGNSHEGASKLHRSIIWQPGKTTLQLSSGPPLELLDVMVSERASLDGGNTPYVVQQDPRFVDPANGDYSLRAGSPALDYTQSIAGDANDLYSRPRDVDLPIVSNRNGRRDLGAIERQVLQPLFLNTNFDADLRLWATANAGVTTWDNTVNVIGAVQSGSAHIRLPTASSGTRTGGIVQCVHLPGPGTYSLNGWGRGTGTSLTPGDLAELYWEFRKVGGETCRNGSPNATGTKTLSNGNSWTRPATPAYITVTEQDWTYTSSIAVTLVAVESGPAGAPTNAWFDGITLGVVGDDTIFSNGFDSQ